MPASPPSRAPTRLIRAIATRVMIAAPRQRALVDGQLGQAVGAAQQVEAVARDQAEHHDHDGEDDGPEPDPEALLEAAEAGHPGRHVAAGDVGDQHDHQQHDPADQAEGPDVLRVGGRLGAEGAVQPQRGAHRGEQGAEQDRRPGGGEPAEERAAELHAAELLLLAGDQVVVAGGRPGTRRAVPAAVGGARPGVDCAAHGLSPSDEAVQVRRGDVRLRGVLRAVQTANCRRSPG